MCFVLKIMNNELEVFASDVSFIVMRKKHSKFRNHKDYWVCTTNPELDQPQSQQIESHLQAVQDSKVWYQMCSAQASGTSYKWWRDGISCLRRPGRTMKQLWDKLKHPEEPFWSEQESVLLEHRWLYELHGNIHGDAHLVHIFSDGLKDCEQWRPCHIVPLLITRYHGQCHYRHWSYRHDLTMDCRDDSGEAILFPIALCSFTHGSGVSDWNFLWSYHS